MGQKLRKFTSKFRKPSSVAGILADFHGKVKQLEEHKVTTSRKIVRADEDAAEARRRGQEAEAEWTQAHHVLGKLQDLLGA